MKGRSVATTQVCVVPLNHVIDAERCVVGHLENEVYEFLSRTPDGLAFKVVRTITMWSCCDEDQWSPGCVAIPAHASDGGIGRRSSESFLPDVFPDSDLEVYGDHTTTPKTARPSFRTVATD